MSATAQVSVAPLSVLNASNSLLEIYFTRGIGAAWKETNDR